MLTDKEIFKIVIREQDDSDESDPIKWERAVAEAQEKDTLKKVRELFLKYLTWDSETKDARRRDFNQAIFSAKEGWACFHGTDLDMVMEKFDKAVTSLKRGEMPGVRK